MHEHEDVPHTGLARRALERLVEPRELRSVAGAIAVEHDDSHRTEPRAEISFALSAGLKVRVEVTPLVVAEELVVARRDEHRHARQEGALVRKEVAPTLLIVAAKHDITSMQRDAWGRGEGL